MKAELSGGKKSSKSQRLSGGGRTQLAAAVNDRVRQWVLNMRERRKCVSHRLIRLEAMKIASELVEAGKLEANKFTANLGWLEKLLRRNNFSLRATTTTCQKPPADYVPKIIDFVLFLRTQRQQHKYTDANILACDETAVWLDPIGKNCITTKGAKDVIVQTLGHEKVHVTVMLCARANGTKVKPYVLLPRKRPVPAIVQKFGGTLILNWAGKVWMDNSLTEDFLRRAIGPLALLSASVSLSGMRSGATSARIPRQ
eukprot:scpid68464/ scgid22398/ Pogo transposable element with KRAB domain